MVKIVKFDISFIGKILKKSADISLDKDYTFEYYQHFDPFHKKYNAPVTYLFSHQFYFSLICANIKIKIAKILLVPTAVRVILYINGWYRGVDRI